MKKDKQIGRSMIEMLGVLAIIGALSIVGLSTFHTAMTRHKTNELIEDVKSAGFIVVDELFENLPYDEEGLDMAGKFQQHTSYTFKAFPEYETTFEILAKNVPYSVCEEVKKRKVDWIEEIKANGKENGQAGDNICNTDDLNDISFFFNTELNNKLNVECRSPADCSSSKPYCRSGHCTKCETGVLLKDGSCAECPEINSFINGITPEAYYCHMCGKNYFVNTSGVCFGCQGMGNAQNASREECARCPNRCWDEAQQKCLKTTVDDSLNNNGICNFNCPVGKFFGGNANGGYGCADCPTKNNILPTKQTTASHCHTCGENYMLGGANMCVTCSYTFSRGKEASPDECKRCKNRYYDTSTQECLICPTGQKASDDGFSCIDE